MIWYRLPRPETSIPESPSQKPRVDAVYPQIGLPQAVAREPCRRNVGGYDFELICEVKAFRGGDGKIEGFIPQSRYINSRGLSLNRYGEGPFCKFQIPGNIPVNGVYVITVEGIYIRL